MIKLPFGFSQYHVGLNLNIHELGFAPSSKSHCKYCRKQILHGEKIATTLIYKSLGNMRKIQVKSYICIPCLLEKLKLDEAKIKSIQKIYE